jgi:hypothetical protein
VTTYGSGQISIADHLALRIPSIALIGWSLYGEPLDALVFIGAGIITGIIWNLRAEAAGK